MPVPGQGRQQGSTILATLGYRRIVAVPDNAGPRVDCNDIGPRERLERSIKMEPVQAIAQPLLVISLAAFGVVIFATILRALREHSFFGNQTAFIVAVCVTVLSVIGIHEFCTVPGGPPQHDTVSSDDSTGREAGDGISLFLLPYAALGLAILLSLLLLLAVRFTQGSEEKHSSKPAGQSTAHPTTQGRLDGERRFKMWPMTKPQTDKNLTENIENEREDRRR